MSRKSRHKVRLTPLQLGDADLLAAAVDGLARGDRDLVSQTRTVTAAQQELRRLARPDAWEAYLAVEEAANSRAGLLLQLVACWAFEEGRR